jgi:RNA polymerase sigma-70 factor (ECF subfamily)
MRRAVASKTRPAPGSCALATQLPGADRVNHCTMHRSTVSTDTPPALQPGAGAPDSPPATADGELVARACAGEALAFEVLVVKYQRRAAAEIRRVVHDVAITEELTQDAFLRVFDALADLQDRDRFWPWLRTICRNVASSYLRNRQNHLDDRPADPDADSTIAALERHATHGSVEDEVAARQLFEALHRAMDGLPDRQRDAILMREIEGLDYRSIAATMGLPVNTVKSLIFRGRDAIALAVRPLLQPTRSRRW